MLIRYPYLVPAIHGAGGFQQWRPFSFILERNKNVADTRDGDVGNTIIFMAEFIASYWQYRFCAGNRQEL